MFVTKVLANRCTDQVLFYRVLLMVPVKVNNNFEGGIIFNLLFIDIGREWGCGAEFPRPLGHLHLPIFYHNASTGDNPVGYTMNLKYNHLYILVVV